MCSSSLCLGCASPLVVSECLAHRQTLGVQGCLCMQNWDGSGGNGAAMRHFEATGQKYPLVVKLGTITANGADVYSYANDENDMVEDPDLVCSSHDGIFLTAPSVRAVSLTGLCEHRTQAVE